MDTTKKNKLLRIYTSNTDKFKHKPLYEVIVYAAKKQGLSGATVLKGIMGFGASSTINSVKFWEVSEKLPVIVEIIDEDKKIDNFYETIKPYFDKVEKGILITIEEANVIFCKTGKKNTML